VIFDLLLFQRNSNAAIEKAIAVEIKMTEINLLSANGSRNIHAWDAVENKISTENKIRFNSGLSLCIAQVHQNYILGF